MREYTQKEMKELMKNPYTLRVTKFKLSHTAKFKEDFWISYQAGNTPKKIIADMGYNPEMFGQKRIDSLVQHIKKEALSGHGFSEGPNRTKRIPVKEVKTDLTESPKIEQMQHELLYLRQEVEFLKKIIKADNSKQKD